MKLKVKLRGDVFEVLRSDYVYAKTKQLREFGYPRLTRVEVEAQVAALLAKKKFGEGLTVIGRFMEDEVVVE